MKERKSSLSPQVFWIFFLSSLFVSVLFSLFLKREVIGILVTLLSWVVTVALAYDRWNATRTDIFGRLAAGIIAVMLVFVVHGYLPRTDVFVICSRNCPPRVGSAWPLVAMWVFCVWLFRYSVWGSWSEVGERKWKLSLQSFVWYLLLIVWTSLCAYVLYRNASWEVVRVSAMQLGKLLVAIAIFIGAIALIGFGAYLSTRPWRRRKAKMRDIVFPELDEVAKSALLQRIDAFARQSEFQLLYCPAQSASNNRLAPRVGGDPSGIYGEAWPKNSRSRPGVFLMQMHLTAPRLPTPWQGRFLTIYLVDDELEVRSYGVHQQISLVVLSNSNLKSVQASALVPVAIPYFQLDDDVDQSKYLLHNVPGLAGALCQYTHNPEQLLPKLLNVANHQSASPEFQILVGGDPQFIQGAHEAPCSICQQPMRFLMQFCDVTTDHQFGDCGVGYIYGCDAHPDQCVGYIDSL